MRPREHTETGEPVPSCHVRARLWHGQGRLFNTKHDIWAFDSSGGADGGLRAGGATTSRVTELDGLAGEGDSGGTGGKVGGTEGGVGCAGGVGGTEGGIGGGTGGRGT